MTARYIVGDVFDTLATLEADSVDLVFTSPPFLALRSYLPAEHPDKGKEIGSEATPADFLDTLLDVVEACDRVLAPHGSLCFELGDTFAGSGHGMSAVEGVSPFRTGFQDRDNDWAEDVHVSGGKAGEGWPDPKSLCGIPTLFAWSLAYGRNLLRPERETPRWRIRNLVVWARPNPPVGALGDKFRPATSYLTVATKARDRYFDLDAVRSEHKKDPACYTGNGYTKGHPEGVPGNESMPGNPAGAPPLDYWVIPTAPYKGSHYATFPPDLVVKPVKSMSPLRVCRICGEPSRRITETTQLHNGKVREDDHDLYTRTRGEDQPRGDFGPMPDYVKTGGAPSFSTRVETLGWTECSCVSTGTTVSGISVDAVPDTRSTAATAEPSTKWRPGCVLDPFCGSGTTLAVATGHGRDAIGIDLDARNADLALERVGPLMLTVEYLTEPVEIVDDGPRIANPRFREGYRRPGQAIGDRKAYGSEGAA